ncbi:fimbrial protein [Escherichia coli]|nr:fimbrial protein [Escherichia coli]
MQQSYLRMKMIRVFSTVFVAAFSLNATAAVECISGCNRDVNLTITKSFTDSQNKVGETVTSNEVDTIEPRLRATSNAKAQHWFAYSGENIPNDGASFATWQYKPVDDYILIGMMLDTPCYGVVYAPFNRVIRNGKCEEITFTPGDETVITNSPSFKTQIYVRKKIVTGVYSKRIHIGDYGACQPKGCTSRQAVVYNLYVNLNITVPQSCEIDSGQSINIDFGNIPSTAFKTAGVIAQGVQPKSRTVNIACNNIAGNAQLTMRLQADKPNGNIVVSDENNDVGFIVTNNSGLPLSPNNLTSVIPFVLDSNARQNVTIQAYPVSVTGNKPAEGPVTSRAYLRVDFP